MYYRYRERSLTYPRSNDHNTIAKYTSDSTAWKLYSMKTSRMIVNQELKANLWHSLLLHSIEFKINLKMVRVVFSIGSVSFRCVQSSGREIESNLELSRNCFGRAIKPFFNFIPSHPTTIPCLFLSIPFQPYLLIMMQAFKVLVYFISILVWLHSFWNRRRQESIFSHQWTGRQLCYNQGTAHIH